MIMVNDMNVIGGKSYKRVMFQVVRIQFHRLRAVLIIFREFSYLSYQNFELLLEIMSFCSRLGFVHLIIAILLLSVLTGSHVTGSGHSAEGADRRESSRVMTVSEIDHVYPPVSATGYKSYKVPMAVYSPGSPIMYSEERPGRQINSLAPSTLVAMASGQSGSSYGWMDNIVTDSGDQAGASSGWSSDGGASQGKSDCNSALGLFGVLGLISFLTNVLRQISTTTVKPAGRRKRSSSTDPFISGNDSEDHNTGELKRVTDLVLPLLTAVAHAKDSLIPRKCTYREICDANGLLVQELGPQGHAIGQMLTKEVTSMLKAHDPDLKVHKRVKEQILQAGKHGRRGGNCDAMYDHCIQLEMLPKYSIPAAMLQRGAAGQRL